MSIKKMVTWSKKGGDIGGLAKLLEGLTDRQVLVGYPDGDPNANRKENPAMTNATLAYVHDNGAPEANIPQRQFMRPGIESKAPQIAKSLLAAAKAAIVSDKGARDAEIEKHLTRAGIHGVNGIRKTLNEGVPPPLSDATLRARANRKPGRGKGAREGAAWELAWRQAGAEAGVDIAKPLVDTGQLRNGVTYVIRRAK